MIANVAMAAFLSIASILVFRKRSGWIGRSCSLVFAIGFAQMAAQFAMGSKDQPVMYGLVLIVVGSMWILLDAYGCLDQVRHH